MDPGSLADAVTANTTDLSLGHTTSGYQVGFFYWRQAAEKLAMDVPKNTCMM